MSLFSEMSIRWKTWAIVTTVFAIICAGLVTITLQITPQEQAAYKEICAECSPTHKSRDIELFRKGVHKFVWHQSSHQQKDGPKIHSGQSPLPYSCQIQARESRLKLSPQGNNYSMIEQMEEITCIWQEKLYYLYPDGQKICSSDNPCQKNPSRNLIPMQEVRYLKAETGSYNYNTQKFIGENVQFWKYQLPGHTPPQHVTEGVAIIAGKAQNIELTLTDDKPHFNANHMKIIFDPQTTNLGSSLFSTSTQEEM